MSESRCAWCGMLSEGDHAPNCPVGEAKKLRARNAELERQLAEEKARVEELENDSIVQFDKYETMKKRAEQAEQRIAESQRQEPVYCGRERLFKEPVVPQTVEEAVKAEREAAMIISDAIRARGNK